MLFLYFSASRKEIAMWSILAELSRKVKEMVIVLGLTHTSMNNHQCQPYHILTQAGLSAWNGEVSDLTPGGYPPWK
jgi:hypothetical protein